jgi:hypothetical protein
MTELFGNRRPAIEVAVLSKNDILDLKEAQPHKEQPHALCRLQPHYWIYLKMPFS